MNITIEIYPDALRSSPNPFPIELNKTMMKLRRVVNNMVLGPSSGALGSVAILTDDGTIAATLEITGEYRDDPRTKGSRPEGSGS